MEADLISLRVGTAEDFDEIYRVLALAFNDDTDDAERDAEQLVYEPDRTVLAVAREAIVGVASAYTRELAVPGGALPTAHVTMVGGDPTYRRRGGLTRVMSHQPAAGRGRGGAGGGPWGRAVAGTGRLGAERSPGRGDGQGSRGGEHRGVPVAVELPVDRGPDPADLVVAGRPRRAAALPRRRAPAPGQPARRLAVGTAGGRTGRACPPTGTSPGPGWGRGGRAAGTRDTRSPARS